MISNAMRVIPAFGRRASHFKVARMGFQSSAALREKVSVVLVGCGVPERGMGWYHGVNILDGECPSAELTDVVEPWFLGAGADSDAGKKFAAWKEEVEKKFPTKFHASLDDVSVSGKSIALIAGRTADNPRLLRESLDKGIGNIYLEKPGAPTVGELEGMAEYAQSKGAGVFMGYNKNVTKYVTLAREAEAANAGAVTTFIHNNAYKPEELPECFERNCEGMLKNMAVHECALLVTYYNVSLDNIKNVTFDEDFTSCQTLGGFTDFDKVGFTIDTKCGKTVTVKANRCGGSNSKAIVTVDGKEVFRSITPDEELVKEVEVKQAAHPAYMPYFFLQHDDYITLKERVCNHILTDAPGNPEGIATIEIAIETLKVAEHLTKLGLEKFAPK
mmetsp:Transcript_19877/g.26213  ORF Transcript_19877/g.26213 Transcript_19877/m.26213 type:complete len:388 (-) Transcript_19877:229-1392(-)